MLKARLLQGSDFHRVSLKDFEVILEKVRVVLYSEGLIGSAIAEGSFRAL
jgi:hypothetical protein